MNCKAKIYLSRTPKATKLRKIFSMRTFYVFLLLISLHWPSVAQRHDKVLMQKLETLISGFRGDVGIYVRHLKSGKTVAINADSIFPTASMIKIPITIGVFDKIEKGLLRYDTLLTYRDSLLYKGEDILGSFKDGEKIYLAKVLMLMITTSDNTASLWSQYLAGTGLAINEWLERNGYRYTRVNSRTPGRETDRTRYGWGQTTPREMAELLLSIRDGKVISARASERIYRNLIRIYWDSKALSQIPPYIQAASKTGSLDDLKAEVVLVNGPHGDYVFCVITNNLKDQRWVSQNEGDVLIRNVSKLLWNYFERDSDWKPARGIEDWY
jgi:beta-lactamase class A